MYFVSWTNEFTAINQKNKGFLSNPFGFCTAIDRITLTMSHVKLINHNEL